MFDGSPDGDSALPAGCFTEWASATLSAIAGGVEAAVPCDGCTACCRSAQFVHIEPDETETLARIPSALLFPAPRRPTGHVVLGYDEHGHCPMLVDDRCSIYEHRPRTCRVYDCRVFPAAGIDAEHEPIAQRARRWRFDHPTEQDATAHRAVQRAAAFVRAHPDVAGHDRATLNRTQLAVLALRAHTVFLGVEDPDADAVAVEIRAPLGG